MDSIIFDLDGTLWDATGPAYEALIRIEEKEGTEITSREKFKSLIGKPMDEIAEATLLGMDLAKKERIFHDFYKLELELIRQGGSFLYPHLVETLEKLSEDFPLFIVSNCQEGYIETFLEVHGLAYLFQDFLSWGASPQSKGDNILLIMKRHGLKNPVYIGDTRGDELASQHAGIPYYHIELGLGQAESPVARVDDYRQLVDIFMKRSSDG